MHIHARGKMSESERQELERLRSERANAAAENRRLQQLIEKLTEQLGESLTANEELRKVLVDLQAKLDTLVVQQKKRNRRDYGKKTERYNPRPSLAPECDAVSASMRARNDSRLAEMESLTSEDVSHVVPYHQRVCQDCGSEKVKIGEDVTFQLERIVSTMKRLRHIQEILACPKCRGKVIVAPKPEPPFPKSTAGPGLISHLIASRFADFTPAYRLERIYRREGAPIPRSTLCDWILAASCTLEPLYDVMMKRVLQSKVISTDDTEVKIQDKKIDKKIRKGKMTPYRGDKNNPYVVFDFSPNQRFTRNYQMLENFKGFVQCDAAPGFDVIFEDGQRVEVGCNAHSRRKYFECLETFPNSAGEVLSIYSQIYDVEKWAKENKSPPDELLRRRQEIAKPLFEKLQVKLLAIKKAEMPKSPLVKATEYTLEHWSALTRYLEDADLSIDNNLTEQTIKDFVLYRKNALFVGSDAGGKAAAICMSIICSAKRHGVEPVSYLKDIFVRINTTRTGELHQFLPDVWLKSQAANS
jgi:transposase